MNLFIPIECVHEPHRSKVGDKAFALGRLIQAGFRVPYAASVTTDAYVDFVSSTGLRERIFMELNRKSLSDMRWEEMWDAALRVRNLFLTTEMQSGLRDVLSNEIAEAFGDRPTVVRSSAPGEDSAQASFAGIHESYVNITGAEEILKHVKLVWASLWSDRALLYRKELNLDFDDSSMAVLVQQMVQSTSSGVAYSVSPTDRDQAVIEAVHGLNQGLVDGTIEPDRWLIDRESGVTVSFTPAKREMALRPDSSGVYAQQLSPQDSGRPPLSDPQVSNVFGLSMKLEAVFGRPQDTEWTFEDDDLSVLQSRPITTETAEKPEDERKWYLSLQGSFRNLQDLRDKIEQKLLPAMNEEAAALANVDLPALTDSELAEEIGRRQAIRANWIAVYWKEFIPMAHGIRLFGQVYNDVIRPRDPYEFVELLKSSNMLSVERNRQLNDLASLIRPDPDLMEALDNGRPTNSPQFDEMLDSFIERFEGLSSVTHGSLDAKSELLKLLLETARNLDETRPKKSDGADERTKNFLSHSPNEKREYHGRLLDLARASYKLRDDDNIHVGRIEAQLQVALDEAETRLSLRNDETPGSINLKEAVAAATKSENNPSEKAGALTTPDFSAKARQLVGQPAGPGLAFGTARVIRHSSDLFDFKAGEILVCDAVDPNMTFVVPLCKGIVERRGGMLIHGAIIAREYGLPCVTGVPDAAAAIRTGDRVTVDGYLGIVIIE
jgi:rifampicin phosphotransferase